MNRSCKNTQTTGATGQIRPISPRDIGWIISQHGLLYAQEFHFDVHFEIDISRKAVSICDRDDPFTRIWLKEINSNNAGSLAISKVDERVAFINFLLVLPAYREKGIAKELMHFAIQHAETGGVKKVRLETYSCLTNARKLYADLGFRIAGPVRALSKYGQNFHQEFWEVTL
ncbi:GNAT family N-acetyltransferase [Desulfogranum marinum]|uniref:GNAT family N-acetyltransferase n=1 Tax=Desulfogranum marinum TaxID=453220 RepID=UPI0029C8DFFA|nr:GNAT family N-acetyltransferase [Desulfogranum marinum]